MTTTHPICTRSEWLEARKQLLAAEKEHTRQREQLAQRRRALPWVRVDAEYTFLGPDGQRGLGELFGDQSQLVVYHFMFRPEADAGCKGCSFWADCFDPIIVHLRQRDVSFVAVSRAPLEKLQAFAGRFGWTFPWYSAQGSRFNADFGVFFSAEQLAAPEGAYNYGVSKAEGPDMPGVSVFFRTPEGEIFHTYSTYARGIDALNTAYQYLDLVPKGRDEADLPYPFTWLNYRDSYTPAPAAR
jgi:predicted dithiol-disulfide oxidoreductase (DUF899 family)